MKNRMGWIVIFMIIVVALAGCGGNGTTESSDKSESSKEDVLKIGVLAPVTGVMSTHGNGIKMGAQLAEELINKDGGINGRKVKIILEDTKTDPATAAEKAKKLIEKDKVEFLTGTGTSAETLAVIPVVDHNQIPFIHSIEGEAKTCSLEDSTKLSKYVFGSGPTPQMMLKTFMPKMFDKFGKKVYFLGSDYVYPRFMNGIAESITTDNGGEVLGSEFVPSESTDYSAVINRILEAKPDILFVTVPGTDGITFLKQARQFGIFDKMIITGQATFDAEGFSGMGQDAEGVYVVNRYSELIDSPANKAFVEAYQAKYDQKYPIGPTASSGTYGVLMAYKAAVEKAGTTEADQVVAALEGLKLTLPQGDIEIDPLNHIFNQNVYLMQIKDNNYQIIENLGVQKHIGFEGCSVGS